MYMYFPKRCYYRNNCLNNVFSLIITLTMMHFLKSCLIFLDMKAAFFLMRDVHRNTGCVCMGSFEICFLFYCLYSQMIFE